MTLTLTTRSAENLNATMTLKKTSNGWAMSGTGLYDGPCDPRGEPSIINNLSHNAQTYPHKTQDYLEHLWEQLDTGAINENRAQEMLTELGRWILTTNESAPKWKSWNCN